MATPVDIAGSRMHLEQRVWTLQALRRMAQRADAAAGVAVTGTPSYAAGKGSELLWEEMRDVLRTELDCMVRALAPATFVPVHVLAAADVLAMVDCPECIRAQSALARPGGAQTVALQQCNSLTQLLRCVLGQAGGVVGQLGRGIAVEDLAMTPASVAELCRAFEDVPALVRLLPRRVQAAPGRLLMAQQRLLLARLGVQESLAGRLDCLCHDTVLQTLRHLEKHAVFPVDAEQVTAAPNMGEAKVSAASITEDIPPSTGSKIEAGAAVPESESVPDPDPEPEPEPEGHTTSTGWYERCGIGDQRDVSEVENARDSAGDFGHDIVATEVGEDSLPGVDGQARLSDFGKRAADDSEISLGEEQFRADSMGDFGDDFGMGSTRFDDSGSRRTSNRPKRHRMELDTETELRGQQIKNQLSDTSDIVRDFVQAPCTRKELQELEGAFDFSRPLVSSNTLAPELLEMYERLMPKSLEPAGQEEVERGADSLFGGADPENARERLQATLSFDTVPGGGDTMAVDVKAVTVGCSPNHPEPDQIPDATLRTPIVRVLKQVHQGVGITSAGRLVLEELLFGHVEPQLVSSAWQRVRQRLADSQQVPHVSLAEVAAAMSPADLVAAVLLHIPGELAKHGIAKGMKAVTKFHQAPQMEYETAKAKTTHSSRAGLVFCVQRSARQLWQQTGAHGDGPSDSMFSAAVFLAAVNEYMCAEILALSGNAAHDNKKRNISPRHICLAIRNDAELDRQFKDFAILGGVGVPVVKLATLLSVYRNCTKSELNYWLSQCSSFTEC